LGGSNGSVGSRHTKAGNVWGLFFLSFSFCKRYHNYFSGVGGSDGKRGILQLLLIRNRVNTNLGMSWLDFTFIEYLLGIFDDNSLSS
jgi:hypothetical protein